MYYVIATENERKLIKNVKYADIIVTGIGYGNIYRALKDIDRNESIVNVGYAGSNGIKVGTRCYVKWSRNYHPKANFEEQEYTLTAPQRCKKCICYTSSDFVTETYIKEPVLFDMELYAIMAMGFKHVISIKYVSDNLSYSQYEESSKGKNKKWLIE